MVQDWCATGRGEPGEAGRFAGGGRAVPEDQGAGRCDGRVDHEGNAADRTIEAQVGAWKQLLCGVCQSGQMSEGRFDAYCRNIGVFVAWIGQTSPIDAIDEAKLEGFFNHLSASGRRREVFPQLCPHADDDRQAVHLPPGRDEADPAAGQHPLPPLPVQPFRTREDRNLSPSRRSGDAGRPAMASPTRRSSTCCSCSIAACTRTTSPSCARRK